MSDKRKCPGYMIYESQPFPKARIKMHIAPCDKPKRHDGLHTNTENSLEWE